MAHLEIPPTDADIALERLKEVYPLAFALASASTFRTGVALRQRESARRAPLIVPSIPPDQLAEFADKIIPSGVTLHSEAPALAVA